MQGKSGSNPQAGILDGIRVIDFTLALAGPHCAKLMADLGAEVIKIEPPITGESCRPYPPMKNGSSAFFLARNAGKKSLCLDMKQPQAVEIFKDLARVSDVVVQNRRAGVMARLGVGYEDLKKVNPRIIMCSISGYGQDGPMAEVGGSDLAIQAMSGAMAITGHPDGPPLPCWVPWVDFGTGTHALAAVGMALFHRAMTGEGQHIDVAMLDCAFSYHDFPIVEYLVSEGKIERTRTGGMHPSHGGLGIFACRDGYLIVSAALDHTWARFAELIGQPDLVSDPRFDSVSHRTDNREEVNRIIAEWIKNYDVSEAEMLLESAGILGPRVLSIGEIVNHPQIQAREMLVEVDDPRAGKLMAPSTPFKFSETKARVRGPAPLLGEHNDAILTGVLGYSNDRVDQLWEKRVLYAEEAVSRD